MSRTKSVKIAGVVVRDPDIVAVLKSTEHLSSECRYGVLKTAAQLVRLDQFGFTPRVRGPVQAVPLEALK